LRAVLPLLGFGTVRILLQPHDPDVTEHQPHDHPPLDELEHALERALAAWPTVRAAWQAALERWLVAQGV
jgi:hypothetical protein